MSAHIVDLSGRKFGRLLVKRLHSKMLRKFKEGTILYWECECSCGRLHRAQGNDLKSGKTTSCGQHQKGA